MESGVGEQAVKQLFESEKFVCYSGYFDKQMKQMMETVDQSNVSPTESETLRLVIREEVKEMEKRKEEDFDSCEGLGSAFWSTVCGSL